MKKSHLFLLKCLTSTLSSLTPTLTSKLVLKYLFKPHSRRKYHFRTVLKPEEFNIKTLQGNLKLYNFKKNSNKSILLSHGWADTSVRFTHLINHLNSLNFNVWAFDHIGHGKSETDTSNLFSFIDGLEETLNFMKEKNIHLNCILGHSMGALSVLNINNKILKNTKIILVSMPVKFFENLFINFQKRGLSKKILKNILNHLSKVYKKDWTHLSAQQNKYKINKNFLFIHDQDDNICSYSNLIQLIEEHPHKFLKTKELGHLKLLRDKTVFQKIESFICTP